MQLVLKLSKSDAYRLLGIAPQRLEIWLHQFKAPDKRRPVVVLRKQTLINLLDYVTVAPISSTIHGSSTEVVVGIDEGLKNVSAINLTNVQAVPKSTLVQFVGTLSNKQMKQVGDALSIATGCNKE